MKRGIRLSVGGWKSHNEFMRVMDDLHISDEVNRKFIALRARLRGEGMNRDDARREAVVRLMSEYSVDRMYPQLVERKARAKDELLLLKNGRPPKPPEDGEEVVEEDIEIPGLRPSDITNELVSSRVEEFEGDTKEELKQQASRAIAIDSLLGNDTTFQKQQWISFFQALWRLVPKKKRAKPSDNVGWVAKHVLASPKWLMAHHKEIPSAEAVSLLMAATTPGNETKLFQDYIRQAQKQQDDELAMKKDDGGSLGLIEKALSLHREKYPAIRRASGMAADSENAVPATQEESDPQLVSEPE